MKKGRLDELMEQYYQKFHDVVPTFPLLEMYTEDQDLIDVLEKCIKDGKDVYEEGIITLSHDEDDY